ncbi:hypothetical protein [Candidatus Cyanaurora vandensis]|uniref:hypothetical protein n=1 Tax=Candidatus Cyanaurora vandensis TaxID=2714958 RepID=UPI00257BA9A8|nr:hypothetical protein [Candidatus Cyanaurora vandensis]
MTAAQFKAGLLRRGILVVTLVSCLALPTQSSPTGKAQQLVIPKTQPPQLDITTTTPQYNQVTRPINAEQRQYQRQNPTQAEVVDGVCLIEPPAREEQELRKLSAGPDLVGGVKTCPSENSP